MIDTHAHLSKRFCDITVGEGWKKLKAIVLAASCLNDSKENIKLANENTRFYAAVGIHPQNTDPEKKISIREQLNLLEEMVKNNKKGVAAIGETGLDYSPALEGEEDRSRNDQEKLFRGQIEIAIKYKLPLIIHARGAVDEVIEILKGYKLARGVFHCYAGGKKRIKKVMELGDAWYFGIDGNLTYEVGLEQVVIEIPNDRLLLETDSPFLTPIPYRGEKNKPEYVEFVYKKVAEIWQKSFKEIEKIIDENAKRLFGI
jgi:TatD DNase family protein